MTDKLKNCPFCGGEAIFEEIPTTDSYKFIVCCKNKKCCAFYIGYQDEGLYTTKEGAIDAWNNRKPMEQIVEQLGKLRQEYPYKVVGEYDTYSTYNEAWSDCSDRAIQIVKGVQNE